MTQENKFKGENLISTDFMFGTINQMPSYDAIKNKDVVFFNEGHELDAMHNFIAELFEEFYEGVKLYIAAINNIREAAEVHLL